MHSRLAHLRTNTLKFGNRFLENLLCSIDNHWARTRADSVQSRPSKIITKFQFK